MTDARDGLLRNLLQKIATEQKYENPDIETSVVPSTGASYTSQLFHAKIKSKGKNDINVFAKLSVTGESIRQQFGNAYDIELLFYSKIATKYEEIEDKHKVPEEHRLLLPKFYGRSDDVLEEIIVLQDLCKDGFVTYDRRKTCDWTHASKAVEELAKFHALSIAFQIEYPAEYKEVVKMFLDKMFNETGIMAKLVEKSIETTLQIVRPELRGRLQKFYDTYNSKTFANFYLPKKRPVITHNDFRQSNMLYKVTEAFTPLQKENLQIVILDYQTLYQGSMATDLLYFIFIGSDGAFREKYYDQLIDHYYENLGAALRRLNLDPEEAFPRRDFDEELKENLPFGLLISCMALPITCIDQDNITTTDGQFEFENMEVLTNMMSNGNAECYRRVNEVLDDYVKWGLL